ncbi:peptidoglycan DD-metalloendopeptidase family protein [Heliobacterium chlorum]|uniref:Peptidoglycan DD-metalloendopeptidase family protein n=1 Tax=Heliobacterium chlorum TaxID=2698 RepID=A0ABR7T3V7_HELCL|nr:M23 family metallopeptidase [Heliobacterium chlorum]MBC9784539.1 peptidoglycan DD-metalloendopeptidase family protein [Heliobacterium chlorum]
MSKSERDGNRPWGMTRLFVLSSIALSLSVPLPAYSDEGEDGLFRLFKGDSLTMLASDAVPSEQEAIPEDLATHRVAEGETLYGIARSYGLKTSELCALNHLDPNQVLAVGRTLIIPGSVETVEPPADSTAELSTAEEASSNDKREAENPRFASRGALLSSMRFPLEGIITSTFGPRHKSFHHGVDIATDTGKTIRVAQSGQVSYAGWLPIYGNTVIVDHAFGVSTLYAHASKLLVEKGDKLDKGDSLALVGSTGVATGPHLHFEVRLDRQAVNPLAYIRSTSKKV